MSEPPTIPASFFVRVDESSDALFYREPRFVTHIDDATIDSLTNFYRQFLQVNSDVLDLMSSWISHLPADVDFSRVSGLGMNLEELQRNPRLDDFQVHDLNENPQLPYPDSSFDRVTIAVSIQYLIRPQEVFSSIAKVLRPDGEVCIAMSHRLFATKAIAAFQHLAQADRIALVRSYLQRSGFIEIEYIDRSPDNADPLWLVVGRSPGKE
jgi:SAM-dependent methyltransferase